MQIYVKSHWGVPLKGRFINNDSDTLCIILPGIAYLLDRSYLDYGKKMASELGMDVYEMEYGFQLTRDKFDIEREFNLLADESIEAITRAIKKPYSRYVIIGKSIGTCIQILLNNELQSKGKPITNVYLSPIDKTVAMGVTKDSLVLTGLSDPLITHENIDQLKQIEGTKVVAVEGANHSLDIEGDILKTLDVLKENFLTIKEFIS